MDSQLCGVTILLVSSGIHSIILPFTILHLHRLLSFKMVMFTDKIKNLKRAWANEATWYSDLLCDNFFVWRSAAHSRLLAQADVIIVIRSVRQLDSGTVATLY